MSLLFIIGIPVILAVCAQWLKRMSLSLFGWVNACGYAVVAVFSAIMFYHVAVRREVIAWHIVYVDALSALFVLTIAFVGIATALYSIGYISHDTEHGVITTRKARVYYVLFNLFMLTMFFVTMVNNLGMMWVGIEMTTLVSAFLVGFYNTKQSVEAAWKYIIICSVGIIIALLGTILLYYALVSAHGMHTLNWTDMRNAAPMLDKNIVSIAFVFILIGYGTKAGLAPMHTWLPDAHSQAVAPISALLSGVLIKTALYAIMRCSIIVNKTVGGAYTSNLLLVFGLITMAVGAGLILVQKDLKRMFAYSSIENCGLISVGLGIGGTIGLFGALLHIFNHAMTKSLLFCGAGNIIQRYNKHTMSSITGVVRTMPVTGVAMLVGVYAIIGFPCFSIFISKFMILLALFRKQEFVVGTLVLVFIAFVFAAVIHRMSKMLFGAVQHDVPRIREKRSTILSFAFLITMICVLGVTIPWMFREGIFSAIAVLKGM